MAVIHALKLPWGSDPPRVAVGGPIWYAVDPLTGRHHALTPGRRWTILLDGEDVTRRVREADAETGEVVLLIAEGEIRPGVTRWKVDRERKTAATEVRRGKVEIRYRWPEDGG